MVKAELNLALKLKNKKGNLIIISLLLVVVLIIYGAAIAVVSINESRAQERHKRAMVAFHIAEAGVERALHDLRSDFINDLTNPTWDDGDINGTAAGPNTVDFYTLHYSIPFNSGAYYVELKNVSGTGKSIWIRATGTLGDTTQVILVYAKIRNIFPWDNAIFAGAGAAGAMINGNVNIRGSVHILGTGLAPTDYAVDLGGTAELIGNNYTGLAASLQSKVTALPTTLFNGETVSTLNAELRVKRGIVGLSGAASAGETNVPANSTKETIDGSFVTNGFGGSQGTSNVYSDNGWSNAYDLGDTVTFPLLSDPYAGYSSYQNYLRDNALVITDAAALTQLASVTPNSSFSYSGVNGSISMDGSGNLNISGIVYVDGGNLNMTKVGANKTITYSGSGSILVTGNAQIDVNLVTNGNNSFPTNIIGVMTPNTIGFNEANIDVMGLFYAQNQIKVEKQTDLVGTIVSNFFDMGANVPSVFQVPATAENLPLGMISGNSVWFMVVVSWQKI